MDEAARCTHLLLMREGRIIAADAPDALLRRTAAKDIEQAFLTLVAQDADTQSAEARNADAANGAAR
jgi:ABC-2 type transport system ATP-binding protein